MKYYKEGDIIPVILNNVLKWAVIIEEYKENYHIIHDLGIRIYRVLLGSTLLYIDDICIYNANAKLDKEK